MFGGQMRSNKMTALLIGVVIFISAFVGLMYHHVGAWPVRGGQPPVDVDDTFQTPSGDADHPANPKNTMRDLYLDLHKPSIKPNTNIYRPFGAFEWKLPEKVRWAEPLGERLCIIDLDNRPFKGPNQIFGEPPMSWDNANEVHGLSLGVLNHWLYAKIHGYKYYFIEIDTPADRRASWKKPPIMSKILKDHDACIYLDSDAIFENLDLPFEWLMNYWDIHPDTNSLALAADPVADGNRDKFGKIYLNTGFIVAQNNAKTYEIMDAWENCPEEDSKHPDCVIFRTNRPGSPTDQGGFGTYIRYDYAKDIKELSCNEANGYPTSKSGCNGQFIRHLWTGKSTWIKVDVGLQLPGPYLELFHKEFLEDKKNFFLTEPELMKKESAPAPER